MSIQNHEKYTGNGPETHTPRVLMLAMLLLIALLIPVWWFGFGMNRDIYWQNQVDLFLYLNSLLATNPMLWSNLSQLCDALILIPLLSFLILTRPIVWAAFIGSIPVATLLTHGGKALASMPRPAAVLDHKLFNIVGENLAGADSLPSGHTASIFVAGTVIALFLMHQTGLRRWAVLPVVLLISIVALSRVAVGAHWPLDIVVGAVCGIAGGASGVLLAHRHKRWWSWIKQPENQFVPGVVLFFWSLSLNLAVFGNALVGALVVWLASIAGIATSCYLMSRRFSTAKDAVENTSAALPFDFSSSSASGYERKTR